MPNDHYVAQTYLKRFTNQAGKFYAFDRKENKYIPTQPKSIAAEQGRNTFIDNKGVPNREIEQLLSIIEGRANKVIAKVEAHLPLASEDREELAIYAAFQFTRVPDYEKYMQEGVEKGAKPYIQTMMGTVEQAQQIIEEFKQETGIEPDKTAEELMEFFQSDDWKLEADKNYYFESMLRLPEIIWPILQSQRWIFAHCPADSQFITSDNPIFIQQPPNCPPDYIPGIIDINAPKVLPLSSSICLIIGGKGADQHKLIARDVVRKVNLSVAANSDRFVVARDADYLRFIVNRSKVNEGVRQNRIESVTIDATQTARVKPMRPQVYW